jgi:hypothetical protein
MELSGLEIVLDTCDAAMNSLTNLLFFKCCIIVFVMERSVYERRLLPQWTENSLDRQTGEK